MGKIGGIIQMKRINEIQAVMTGFLVVAVVVLSFFGAIIAA